MTLAEAQRLARRTFGSFDQVELSTVNGMCVVTQNGERIGVGANWKQAMRLAVLKASGCKDENELAAKLAKGEER